MAGFFALPGERDYNLAIAMRQLAVAASFRNIFLISVFCMSSQTALAQGLQNMPSQTKTGNPQGYFPPPSSGMNPGSLGSNIWNSVGARVPIGTLLSGVLEDDLSSAKNQRGDVFSIRLEDGYFKNGVEVVPRHSRIVGAVVNVVPSSLTGHGHPGNLQVNLQTIVFPDGSNTPISGFIVHNPNMDETQNPRRTNAADAAAYYPKATVNSLGMIGRTLTGRLIGYKPGFRNKGSDFTMEKGEILAVRLNRSLDLSHMSAPATNFAPGNVPFGLTSPTVPALKSGQPLLPTAPATISGPNAVMGGPQPAPPSQNFNKPVGPNPGLNISDPF
ncbi:MAG TPA: hypothetical protein PKZ32_13330 [Candidatus Melainabacteria bacterium]|jgi:hypothetical protein|nr:hypothetical protein [Candidatus Melainabacteria bacterium]